VPETLRLWAELSGHKIREFRPFREGYIVDAMVNPQEYGLFYIYQVGGDIHVRRTRKV
jgi:hypothetical protein